MKKYRVRVLHPGSGDIVIDETVVGEIVRADRHFYVFKDHSENHHYYPIQYTIFDEIN